ncbi:hypothetical protein MKK84_18725 [Methylobacterium sp. E-065]|uniref:hypothetical protein n=1 Tax=Methylobacterium sp. E-065 TaxID=2836583 RepID=UPI001FBB9BE8|nr:hypothetical protein [Methylobacterium sp. E-065]MCJ2019446.1 hypothetical protein [Methylobacterium sp. E-065]
MTLVAQLVAAGKIIVTESGALFNRRVSDELATRERVSSGRRAAGERGGNASGASRAKSLENNEIDEARASTETNQIRGEEIREETPSSPSNDDGSERPALFEGIENVTPLKRRDSTKPAKAVVNAAFEQFWGTYPRREGSNPRKPAFDKFARAVEAGADPEAIIAGARRYAADLRRTGKIGTGYVAQSVTWLNQQRWADDNQPNAPPNTKWHMV